MSDQTQVCALPGCRKDVEQTTSGEPRRYCCAAHRKIARKRRRDNLPARVTAPKPTPDESPSTPAADAVAPTPEPPAPEPPCPDDAAADIPAPTHEPPASEPPARKPPAHKPPAGEPPAHEPPTSEPPASKSPTNEPPASEPPTSKPPASKPPPPTRPGPAPAIFRPPHPPAPPPPPLSGSGEKTPGRGQVVPEPKRGRFRRREAVPYAARKVRGKRPPRATRPQPELPDWLQPATRRGSNPPRPTDPPQAAADAPADPRWVGFADPAPQRWSAPVPALLDSDTDTTPIPVPLHGLHRRPPARPAPPAATEHPRLAEPNPPTAHPQPAEPNPPTAHPQPAQPNPPTEPNRPTEPSPPTAHPQPNPPTAHPQLTEPNPPTEPIEVSAAPPAEPAPHRPVWQHLQLPSYPAADDPEDRLRTRNARKVERAENKATRQLRKAERTAARRAQAALSRDEAAAVLTGALLPGEEPPRKGNRRRGPIAAIEPPAGGPAWAGQMYEAISAALHSLNNNRLRAVLTTIGIIAGVGAVIVLVALGDGMKANYNDQVEKLANQITISPVVGGVSNGAVPRFLTDSDVKALQDKEKAPDIVALSPQRVGTKITVTAGQNQDNRTILVGCTENYLRIINRHMMAGEWFTPGQITGGAGARPVILGPQTVNLVFGFGTDPHSIIGQPIRLAHSTFRIQGVLKSDGANDDTAVVPLSAARAYLVGDEGGKLDQVVVKATNASKVQDTVDQIIDILDTQHHVRTEAGRDYDVKTYTESLKQSADFIKYLTIFVIAIAAISLFVGGVGVANIMLVSVTERTREIGIRKAVGAPRRAILRQFLSEAVVLTGLGGLAGVGLGIGLAKLGNVLIPKFVDTSDPNSQVPLPILSVSPVVTAFLVSLAIGLAAGGYPAYRAARMRPIEALRFE